MNKHSISCPHHPYQEMASFRDCTCGMAPRDAPPALPLCPHGATDEEVCPECLGAPSDNPDDEIESVEGAPITRTRK